MIINHAQHSTAQHSTAQHSTAQHSTAQHSTAQHSRFSSVLSALVMHAVWASSLVQPAAHAQSVSAAQGSTASTDADSDVLPEVHVSAEQAHSTEATGSYTGAAPSTSATRLPLTLRETPQAVSIITRQRMQDQNLTSLTEVMRQAPGVAIRQWGAGDIGYVFYYARGFQINNYQLDGMITSSGAMQGFTGLGTRDMAVYDHVTVVRGATGLLTGAGDPAASINLVRKRPTPDFQGHASAQASRWSRYRGELDLSGPLDHAGRIRGRLVAAHEDHDTWIAHVNTRKNTLYAIVETDLTANTALRAGFEYFRLHNKGSGVHGFRYADTAGGRTHFTGYDNPWVRQSHSGQERSVAFATLEHRFANGWQAQLGGSHTRVDSHRLFGVAANAIQPGSHASRGVVGKTILTPGQKALDGSITGFYDWFGQRHELVAGFNAWWLARNDPNYPALNFDIPDIYAWDRTIDYDPAATGRNIQKVRQSGAYLATRLKPADALALIAGARIGSYHNDTLSTAQVGQAGSSKQDASNVFTPYLGAVYDFTAQWSAYASYSTIFNPQGNKTAEGKLLSPERGKSYEVGMKGELLDGQLNVSAVVFRTLKDNLAVADGSRLTPEGNQAYIGANDTTAKGWEFEAAGQIQPGWQAGASYTRVATRDSQGARLNTSMPQHQVKLFTSYRPGATADGVSSALTVGGGLTWQSKTWETGGIYTADELRQFRQNRFFLLDLMARYAFSPQMELSLNLENALDKRWRVHVVQHPIGAPRNLTATLRYRF